MKPVELEIFLQDGLSPGLRKAGAAMNALSGDARKMTTDLKARIREEQALVKSVEADVRALEKAYEAATPGKMKNAAHAELQAAKKALEEERNALRQHREELAKYEAEQKQYGASLRMELRNLQQEVATLLLAYRSLTEEEKQTAQGRQLAQHIEDLTEKAGTLRDAMADTTQAVNNSASDTRGFDRLAGGVQLVVDGFGLATAGAQALGLSEADLMEVQTRLQTALVASNALTSMQTNLQKQSALMQGVAVLQTKAAATAENIRAWAVGRGTVVTRAATIAQAAFNAVAKANPYVILAMACLSVVGALMAFSKGSDAAKKAEEERQARMEKARQEQENYRKVVVDAAGEQIASFLKLKKAWENLGDSFDQKKKFIADTKEEWRKLGWEINNVNDMEKMFREHSKDMLDAIITRAELKAYETRIQGVADEMVDEIEKNKVFTYTKVRAGKSVSYIRASTSGRSTVSYSGDLSKEEQDAIQRDVKRYTRSSSKFNVLTELTAEGAALINDMRRKAGNQAALDRQKAARQQGQDRIGEYLDTMNELSENLDKKMEKLPGKKVDPESSGSAKPVSSAPENDNRVENERRVNEELSRLRWENEQDKINAMAEGAEKRRRQIALDYEKQLAEIQEQEDKWRELQEGNLTPEQDNALKEAQTLATQGMENAIRQVEKDEVAKSREKLNELLEQYKDYDQRRRDIESSHKADMEVLNAELARLQSEELDTTEVESAISAREQAYKESISALEGEILQASDFYDKLFGTVSDRGYKVLKDFYAQAKETLDNAKLSGDSVEISIPVKDADGKFVKKAVNITVDEYRRMLKQVQETKKQLEKDNPFAAFKTSWSELNKAIKDGGDVSGAFENLNAKGKEVTGTIRGWGESLGAVFGDNFAKSMGEITTFCDGMMNMGTGIAQIWSGDIVGGITNALNGLASIFSMFSSWKEKMEEMKREWYIAEIETNRTLRERASEYAANRSKISDIIKDVELLNWLIAKGYAKPSSVSVWEAESSALSEYTDNLREEEAVWEELWEKVQGSEGHYEWGNSLVGGSATWSLRGYRADMIELWYNQGKLSDEAKAYYEAWIESGKTIEELIEKIEECKESLREMVIGVSFDNFLSNAADALKKMRGDVSELGKFTEDTLAEAILNGFMYRDLAKVLEPLYNELSDAFINGTVDEAYLEDWRRRFEEAMAAAGDRLDAVADAAGVNLDSGSGTSQSGKSGGFAALSQDQGTKLEGLFVSVQMHTASIDERMEDVTDKMTQASETLRKIEENTGRTANKLEEVADDVKRIIRDGIKTR